MTPWLDVALWCVWFAALAFAIAAYPADRRQHA